MPSPSSPEPSWWGPALTGDFDELDEWLERRDADPYSVSGLPSLAELSRAGETEFVTQVRHGHLRGPRKLRELLNTCQVSENLLTEHARSDQPCRPAAGGKAEADSKPPLRTCGTFVFPKGVEQPSCAAKEGYLDLFSGCCGVARELARLTGRWVLCYDIKLSDSQDLSSGAVQREIVQLLESGWILGCGAAPVCSSFSRAVTPACRSALCPEGLPGLSSAQHAKVTLGDSLGNFVASVGKLCVQRRLPFWIENPQCSFLWKLPTFAELQSFEQVGRWTVDFCAFHAPWRKRTTVLTSTNLKDQATLCPGCPKHQVLRGRSTIHRMSWTRVAEPYPRGLSLVLAMAMSGACGDRPEFRKLDASGCARALGPRIGEALHPGPPRTTAALRAERREGLELRAVPLVEARTETLEVRLWDNFRQWVALDMSAEAVAVILDFGATTAALLAAYGEHLFHTGAPLSHFRHLLAWAQRNYQDFRLHSRDCWNLVTRWEQVEPLVHREPLPHKLCQAMVSLALCWGWPRFGLVLFLAFEGILRIGEVLRALRADLVLPADIGSEVSDRVFLRIRLPKTRRRGGARQQHATVQHAGLVRACERVFGSLPPDAPLYPLSAQSFRRRWDDLLQALHVSSDIGLTPASVRGGAAVHAYRQGTPVHDLLWRMRLQHIQTLQHYLQELAAETVLGRLTSQARHAVDAAVQLLPFFLRSLAAEDP